MTRHSRQPTLLRHGPVVRVAHAGQALVVMMLVISGLGMAERLPKQAVSILGGHVWLGDLHRWLGVAFGAVIVGLLLFGPASGRQLIRDMCRFRRNEIAWFRSFTRYVIAPSRYRPNSHEGRFDPGQRIVFATLLASFTVLMVSAAGLYLAPARATTVLAWSLRTHIVAAVVFMLALVVHIVVGTGILASHRNIGRVMFGDGHVQQALAHTLWPRWAEQSTRRRADPIIAHPPKAPVNMTDQAQRSDSIDRTRPERDTHHSSRSELEHLSYPPFPTDRIVEA